MITVYEKTLELQTTDQTLRVLTHKREKHVLVVAVRECEEEIFSTTNAQEQAKEEAKQKNKSLASLDRDVADITSKLQRSQETLASGSVSSAKGVASLETEIAFLNEKRAQAEDEQLEIMEQLEALEVQDKLLKEAADAQSEKLARLQGERDLALASIDDEVASLAVKRTTLSTEIAPELLEKYESQRTQFDGLVLARLQNGICEGCHMQLSSHLVDQFKNMSPDDELLCEECGRILVAV